ncbi:MAG: SDR family oxidoreductase [Gammaproteobacteria bacterium]|nr:SDR family oxidoreductase [Gammaproteobacteria bacterium]
MARMTLVTGGTRGIGAAISVALRDADYTVAANYGGNEDAARAFSEKTGIPVYKFDVGKFDQCEEAVRQIENDIGAIDILVNNAGMDRFANFLDTEPELWDAIIDVNLRGTLNMHHVVLPGMRDRGWGRVVNIASDAARVGSSMEAVYSACKGGIVSFTKSVARELARSGVRLNVVCPGPTDTPLLAQFLEGGEDGGKIVKALERAVPMKRIGRPEDIPGIVAFLASDDAEYITGQVISVSGGLTMHG